MKKSSILWSWSIYLWVLHASFASDSYYPANHGLHQRSTRSIKQTFSKKSPSFEGKIMAGMQGKISSLESSVKNASEKVTTIETRNNLLETTLNEQQIMLEKIEKDLMSIENQLSARGESLDELKHFVYPDEKAFSISNESCGGVLFSQSGFVTYTSKSQVKNIGNNRNTSYLNGWVASTCVWVVQANHRSIVKLTANLLDLAYSSNVDFPAGAYVLEDMAGLTTTGNLKPPKVTKLMRSVTYSFQGPLLYVVLFFPDNTLITSLNTFSFQFQYEGQGRRIEKGRYFSHKHLDASITNLYETKDFGGESGETPLKDDSLDGTFSTFSSIVISDFVTKLRLRAVWDAERCSSKNIVMTVLPVTDFLFNTSNQTALTKYMLTNDQSNFNFCNFSSSQRGTQMFTSYGKPVLIYISKPFGEIFPLNLSWTKGEVHPSSYIVDTSVTRYGSNTVQTSSHGCGSVLGGSTGYIAYKRQNNYRNGERCVWVISPQPSTLSSIDITFTQDSSGSHIDKEANNYDHVYILELTESNGEEKIGGPKVTRLNLTANSYKARSREVYVIFYSDASVTSNGFVVSWKTSGELVETGDDISTQFNFFSGNMGRMELSREPSSFFKTIYQVFIFTPILPSTWRTTPNYVFGMEFYLNLTTEETSRENLTCIQHDFNVLAPSDNGILQKRDNVGCDEEGKSVIKNADGMVIIIAKNSAPTPTENLGNVTFDFSWKQEFQEGDSNVVKMENDRCGGVIIGERGILRYKLEQKYNRNEHCIWLLQSPNATSITLNIIKEGFGSQARLIVNTINPDAGTLRNDAVQLNTPSQKSHTFNDSLLVISFRPSSFNSNATGFLLKFWSSADNDSNSDMEQGNNSNFNTEYIDYRLRHSETQSGRFLYEWSHQTSHALGEQLHIIAYSTNTVANVAAAPFTSNISWAFGVLKKDKDSCTYDSISFYSTITENNSANEQQSGSELLWENNVLLPEENSTTSCPNQVKVTRRPNMFTAQYSAFLVIYKLVAFPVQEDSGGDERKIDFSHAQIRSNVASPELEPDEDLFTSRNPFSRSYAIYQRQLLAHLLQRRLQRPYHRQYVG